MTKSKQILLAIAGVLVIGSGVWFGGNKIYQRVTAVKVQEKIEKVCDLTGINRIEFKDRTLVTLEKQDGIWKNATYSYLEYDQEKVNSWVQALMEAETAAIVKNVENSSAYGITEESPMITIFDGADAYETYHIGSVMNNENKIYIKKDSENEIFIIPFDEVSLFRTSPNTFVNIDGKLYLTDIQKVTIEEAEGKRYTVSQEDGTWYLEDYYAMKCVLKEQSITKWLNDLNLMTCQRYVTTTDKLEDYGLMEPQYTMTVNDGLTIRFGKETQQDICITINGGQDVYTVDKGLFMQTLQAKYFDMIDKNVLHLDLDDIHSIEITNPQTSFSFRMNDEKQEVSGSDLEKAETKEQLETQQTVEADETDETVKEDEGKEPDQKAPTHKEIADGQEVASTENIAGTKTEVTIVPAAFFNDQVLGRVEAEEYFQMIQSSLVMEVALQNPKIEQKEERPAECSMLFTLKDGSKINIELIPYDINYYILRYNDKIEVAVNKEKITKLFTSLTRLQKK